ncbi:MAG TPA: cytochrome b N-terminal domain-containing protein [Blastocatellia bacterium]|nr:cytochrome b N-terminal domain-containing protein [Blastocatellia bacterium]
MSEKKSPRARLYDWLDERAGLRGQVRKILDEPIRGGARWAYVFGSTLVFLFVLQAITGVFLAMYYVPSADHAHASVAYIQKAVPGGALIRGLHYYGASVMIIVIVAHVAQTFLFGAYKGKRELVWVVGGVLLLLVLGFAFTGYLLPWDQEAYFGTKVGTSIVGEMPVAGAATQRIMLGGTEITSLTLSRFFMTHTFLLPLALALLVLLHLYLFRRVGPAGPFHHRDDDRVDRFYPKQLFKDSLFILAVFIVLVAVAEYMPAKLGPQADPTTDFLARPPWYFLPLFELLKYFPGKLSLIPTVLLPAVLFGTILLLPFLARRRERNPLRRPVASASLVFVLAGAVSLIALSKYQDRSNPEFRAKLEQQEEEAKAFLQAEFQPQQIGRSVAITPPAATNPVETNSGALKIFLANCANCHGVNATGGPLGPPLLNLARRRNLSFDYLTNWIAGHAREPMADSMPRYNQLAEEERRELAEWLLKLDKPVQRSTAALPAAGNAQPPAAYNTSCAVCHGDRGEGNIGPSLIGVMKKPKRRKEDLLNILDNSRAYGLKDPMPKSFPAISEEDKRAIVKWLAGLNATPGARQ